MTQKRCPRIGDRIKAWSFGQGEWDGIGTITGFRKPRGGDQWNTLWISSMDHMGGREIGWQRGHFRIVGTRKSQ